MPIINTLLQLGAKVIIASDGDALHLLKAEYPELLCLELPSYNINYKTANMFVNIAPQVPKILRAIRLERQFLKTIISDYQIDAIISDNRYGLTNSQRPTVFLTHQLNILVPNRLVQAWVTRTNRKLVQKFNRCWVPDVEGEPNLSGKLSHGQNWTNVSYLGLLSRMTYQVELPIKYDVIAVLSGPEPQRSIFEKMLIEQAKNLPQQFLIVSGKPAEQKHKELATNITWQAYMTAKELNQAILSSRVVIARSGYSTVMDLVKLRCKKVLFVPTPGQTEQEYLAQRFYEKQQFYYQEQQNLNLKEALKTMEKFSGIQEGSWDNNSILETTILDFLNHLTPSIKS